VEGLPNSTTGASNFANGVGAVLHLGPLGAYHASVRAGIGWLINEVNFEAHACPAAKIILTGYSQGAQATGDFWQRYATSYEKQHVIGVVLFGDPYFNPADTRVDHGTAAAALDGFHGLLGERPRFTQNAATTVLSYCELWDPICDADPAPAAWALQEALFHKVHTTAYPPDGRRAARYFAHGASQNRVGGQYPLPGLWDGGHFRQRPAEIVVICADEGDYRLHWTSWSTTRAVGQGETAPCRGTGAPVAVVASHVVRHEFTRLDVRVRGDNSRVLILAVMSGFSPMWADQYWVNNPASGLRPWP
jgi:hypothetical protein